MRLRRFVGFPLRICRYLEVDPFLVGAFTILSICWTFVLGSVPYLDGSIDFNKAVDFSRGGFPELFANWTSVHPPFKETLLSIVFYFFGIQTVSYAIIGLLFLYLGLYSCYTLSFAFGGKRVARFSLFFFVTSPMVLATSVFSLTDFLLSCLLLFSFAAYLKRQNFLWTLSLIGLVLVKEPGIIVPVLFLVFTIALWVLEIAGLIRHKRKQPIWPPIVALFTFSVWYYFLGRFEKQLWGDWVFSENSAGNIFQTIINTVISGAVLNPYARENFLHLFVLNYLWVYWSIGLVGVVWLIYLGRKKIWTWAGMFPKTIDVRLEITVIMALFCIGYACSVLRFPTYAIPRYTLPVEVMTFVGFAYVIERITTKKIKMLVFVFFGTLTLVRLFTSTDPFSRYLWGTETIDTQTFYALRHHKAGNDGMTYNLEYVLFVIRRSGQIRDANREGRAVYATNCYWAFPDENNDARTLSNLGFDGIPRTNRCLTVTGQ